MYQTVYQCIKLYHSVSYHSIFCIKLVQIDTEWIQNGTVLYIGVAKHHWLHCHKYKAIFMCPQGCVLRDLGDIPVLQKKVQRAWVDVPHKKYVEILPSPYFKLGCFISNVRVIILSCIIERDNSVKMHVCYLGTK